MNRYRTFYIFLSLFLYVSSSQADIPMEEVNSLKPNQFILKSEKISGKVWPKVYVKAYLQAKPLEAIAIFAAYDLQKSYVPNLVGSKVVKQDPPTDAHVDYKMDLPWPLGYSYYIHGHKLSRLKPNGYQVSWYLIKSDAADDVKGLAKFEPYKNGSLMTYEAFVDPKSFFAGVLKKLMVKDVKKTIEAIVGAIEKYRQNPGTTMPKYQKKIIDALSGKKAYH